MDSREWAVVGYPTEEQANEHARKAKVRADELNARYKSSWNIPDKANAYDAQMSSDYTGTDYIVQMVEISKSVPA